MKPPACSLLFVALLASVSPARAADLNLACGDTTMVLTCGDGAEAGNCTTTSASDPAWSVTCAGKSLGGLEIQTICRNATEIGGTHVQEQFSINDRNHAIASAVGTATGSSCKLTN